MKRIDIDKILRDKNPSLAKWTPRFVVRLLEKLVAADHHNRILELYDSRDAIGFIDGALDYIGVSFALHNTENIPKEGKILFAANHPLGGVDGMILATAIDAIRPGVRLIVNDILLNLEPLRPIFVGVNKHGGQGSQFSWQMDELYASNAPIINFAAGLCSRLGKDGKITDLAWRKNFVPRCEAGQRVVIPTYVDALNSKFFYRFGRFRKAIGIKANLEMILLPRQVFHQKGKVVNIYFGRPITLDKSRTAARWCDTIREATYALAPKK